MTQKISKPVEPLKKGIPTASALEYRTRMYPVSKNLETLNTIFGEVRVEKGGLTARSRDYLDAILANRERAVFDSVGQITIVFDDAKVRKALGFKSGCKWEDLHEQLMKIMATVISVRRPDGEWPEAFPMLTHIGDSKMTTKRGYGKYEGTLKKIVLSAGAVDLLMNDTQLFINPAVINKMLGFKHQITRSVLRWHLSQSDNQSHSIRNIFDYVGAVGSERMLRKYYAQLVEDAEAAKEIGLVIIGGLSGGMIRYTRSKEVFISLGKDRLIILNETVPVPRGE